MTAGSEDVEWERQRSLEQEAERQLQKRIKDRVPQKRARGKAKAGDIDGTSITSAAIAYCVAFTLHLPQRCWIKFKTSGNHVHRRM